MSPSRFELSPIAARYVTLSVEDERNTSDPDEDLIYVGIVSRRDGEPVSGQTVALDLDEIEQLRDALTAVIETDLPRGRHPG